ncbi:hypothetical protein [Hyphomicrobium sp.]|uniref:hypothetical protein n=1 Tax=Hyphomicrobium sp. TaxID=82 RepID=UPI0025C0A607|nr:hypothetical protein [Hyphomicrobium sp.]MCC7252214.1 hypothetical protein [Hyphomicrobium sp.]
MAQSVMRRFGTAVGTAAALFAAVAVGGCGMSSLTSGFGSSILGGSSGSVEPTGVSEQDLIDAAKAGGDAAPSFAGGDAQPGCPRFVTWPRDSYLTIYEPGRVGDGLAIMHRGEITKTARECHMNGSQVTVKYGFSGRILLGPRGHSGPISMPINVFVTDAKRERVTEDKLRVDASVAVENPIGYFSAVRTVTFDVPEGARPGEFEVYVGFDRNTPNAG